MSEIDYKEEYEKLKLETEAKIKTQDDEIAQLTQGLTERDKKISELQTYICKNLTTTDKPSGADNDGFIEKYKSAIKENLKG